MKQWYQSKTVWFNFVMTIVLALELFSQVFPETYAQVTAFLFGFGNIILRVWFTNQEIR